MLTATLEISFSRKVIGHQILLWLKSVMPCFAFFHFPFSTPQLSLPVSPLLVPRGVPVVFMGSEKYPSENGFDAFLKKHGGSDNASTDCERTVFQFDVQRKSFKEALDRWARIQSTLSLPSDQLGTRINAQHRKTKLVRD